MFAQLLKAIGWVPKEEREGEKIDYENSLCATNIRDKNEFLAHIIDMVPDGSVWSVEGIVDERILAYLEAYRTIDDVKVMRATAWPRLTQIKVLLNEASKKRIRALLPEWDLNLNFIHQHIYYDENFLLTSFDNLADGITFLSTELDQGALNSLAKEGLFSFVEKQPESPNAP